ncbi:MAG: magnesium transporter [Candidatus Omnitrophica bacterium]|nr:magnesium transporter [Candidatus Omnitrophota bacterium]MBU1924765.1 magnesium transporter [Candidatus Omnitrophota bacterium]
MHQKTHKSNLSMTALFVPEIKSLIAGKNFSAVKLILSKIPSIDIAEGWKNFNEQERILIFKLLSIRLAIELFEALKFKEQAFLLNNLENAEVSQVLNEMAADERANLFRDLSPKVMKRLFGLMKKEEVDDVRELMTYEEGTAGATMTTDFLELKKDITARAAILKLQDGLSFDHDLDIGSNFVTDENHKLIGVVELQDLIKAPPDMLVKDIMQGTDFIKVNEFAPEEGVAQVFKHYDLKIAPVVEDTNKLVGIITVDDIVDIIEKEATEDFEKIAAVLPVDKPYMEAKFFNLVWKRSFWLVLLIIFESISAFVLKSNRQAINNMLALTFFVPIQIAMGGNAGTQSATIIIRSLALGDIKAKNFLRVVLRESLLGVCMGVPIALVGAVIVSFFENNWMLSLAVGVSMGITIVIATTVGASLPLLSRKFKLDPALMSGPMIATIVDIVGIIVYFNIAQLFLPLT